MKKILFIRVRLPFVDVTARDMLYVSLHCTNQILISMCAYVIFMLKVQREETPLLKVFADKSSAVDGT